MLDDPFREVFNNFADLTPSFTFYVKTNTSIALHAKQMPLVLFNTNLVLR